MHDVPTQPPPRVVQQHALRPLVQFIKTYGALAVVLVRVVIDGTRREGLH
tara:strand:+ start:133 stop:282 length:150 start_codon:yes stop_codon:yes gene_type:complete